MFLSFPFLRFHAFCWKGYTQEYVVTFLVLVHVCSTAATFPCMLGNLECYLNGRILQEHNTRHQCACSLQMALYLLDTHTLPEVQVYRKTWNFFTDQETRSALFLLTEAFLHCSHRFSSGTVNISGSLPFKAKTRNISL